MKLDFGKYKGCSVREVPHQYLRWALANVSFLSPALQKEIKTVLGTEADDDPAKGDKQIEKLRRQLEEKEREVLNLRWTLSEKERQMATRVDIGSWWKDWYRRAALTCHPDRNSSDDRMMKLVNELKDKLGVR